ncbi:MAG: ABC transporter substrate-binding protein [Asgard group archaeon]|nr:ABC transporter substrate-binding protein [Asgard group archaeon]
MCTDWQISTDLTTYTFTIKSNAFWHDGQVVDADDVVWTWQTLADDPGIPRRNWLYDNVVSITKLSQFSVEIVLDYGFKAVDVLVDIGTDWILPEHIWKNIDYYDFTNDNPVGCGPFKFASMTNGVEIELARHENYHLSGPWVNQKIIKIIPVQSMAFHYLNSSTVDVVEECTPSQVDYADIDPDINVHSTYQDYWMYLALNQRRYPNNITEFRRAILYGINQVEVIDIARFGIGEVCLASCSLPYGPYYNPAIPIYNYNTVLANSTLDSIGVIDSDADGWREANGTEISFEILVSSESQESVDSVNLIKGFMSEMGINVSVSPVLFSVLWQAIGGVGQVGGDYNYPGKYDYDWCYAGWVGFWSDFHPHWAQWLFSKNLWWGSDNVNIPGWNNIVRNEVSDLTEEISYETDDIIIKQKLDFIQELVANDLPYLPINILGEKILYRIDEFEDWTMGYAKGPDSWDSWLTVHLIGVPTVYEYMNLAGILAVLVVICIFASGKRLQNRKRK